MQKQFFLLYSSLITCRKAYRVDSIFTFRNRIMVNCCYRLGSIMILILLKPRFHRLRSYTTSFTGFVFMLVSLSSFSKCGPGTLQVRTPGGPQDPIEEVCEVKPFHNNFHNNSETICLLNSLFSWVYRGFIKFDIETG